MLTNLPDRASGYILMYFLLAFPVEKLMASTFALLLLFWLIWKERTPFFRTIPVSRISLVLFVSFILAGIIDSDAVRYSIKTGYDFLRALFMLWVGAYLALSVSSRHSLWQGRHLLFLALGLTTVFFLDLVVTGEALSLRDNPLVYQIWGNLHAFANLLAMLTLLLIWELWYGDDRRNWYWLWGLVIWGGIMILATTSRGNLLAFGVVLGLFWALRPVPGRRQRMMMWSAGLAVLLMSYVYLFFFHPGDCLGSFCPGYTYEARKTLYQLTMGLIQERPWFGHGFGAFKLVSHAVLEGKNVVMPHNVYLELLFSAGIVGALLFFAFLVTLIRPRPTDYSQEEEGRLTAYRFKVLALAYLAYLGTRGLVDLKLASFEYLGGVFFAIGIYRVAVYRMEVGDVNCGGRPDAGKST